MTEPSAQHDQRTDVFERARASDVKFVNLQFTDIMGVAKNVTIPFHRFGDAIDHGLWFDGSSIDGFARIHESDMYLAPDLSTFRVIPWESGENTTASVICNVFTPDGDQFPGDPRYVLQRNLADAAEMGFSFLTGPELEFFLLKNGGTGLVESLPHDRASYFDVTTDQAADVRKEMVTALEQLGIVVEATHHEVATGQHEIDFRHAGALQTADNTAIFKIALKSVARRHDLHATFMPKPFYGLPGSGMHTHQSLADVHTGANAFHDAEDEYELSQIARFFIAGQLTHARAMAAIVTPLVNSYKRLVPGYEAPAYISWARTNRSALVRVPRVSAGRGQSTRIEFRCPDPSCNPYLAFAVMLAAGLDGIRRQLPLPLPIEEDLFHFDEGMMAKHAVGTLPASLAEALSEFERDDVMTRAVGDHIAEWFVEAKRQEWNDYRARVTPWEIDRYLETY
ncbi:MAG TPA: type I glutamate--ammonia ligase [Chloroflexota bacterium]|nr:type I glutamate--ammonia ligase [Chloroflexota bacterium]